MLPRLVLTAFGAVATTWIAAYSPKESRHYDVVVSTEFDATDRQEIARSVDAWRHAIPELRLNVRYSSEPCDPDQDAGTLPLICVQRAADEDMPLGILGLTMPRPRGALVALPAGSTQDTIAHELGHAMGLKHSAKCGNLMFPSRYYNGQRCDSTVPTRDDVRAWHAIAR